MAWNIFLSKAEREIRIKDLNKVAEYLAIITNHESPKSLIDEASTGLNKFIADLPAERRIALKNKLISDSILDTAEQEKNAEIFKKFGLAENKSLKEMIFHFFGMDDNWPVWRNLLGGLMVHSPEYPTYFIPAFTQAKAAGEAKDLKKGEGVRGLLTGALEGIAVGALVSGKKLKFGEMGPYILMGAGLQYFSSKVFPWLGEKMGRQIYNNKKRLNFVNLEEKIAVKLPKDENLSTNLEKPSTSKPGFAGRSLYKNQYNNAGNLKV